MARQPSDNRRQSVTPALEADTKAGEAGQPPLRSRPANENDPATAMMLNRLRRRPSYDVIWVSLLLSVVWAAGCFWIYKDVFLGNQSLSQAAYIQAVAILVLPVLVITTVAYFLWQAQRMRQVSEVLMHQAIRLIRPQDLATDGLSSIAQAVRHEVDLLVGGVEHAVQRATALEEIVHKEIAAVERAFGSNEDRIRNLVHGLENQRAALQQTSTMVSADAQPMLQRLESNTHNLNEVVSLALSTFGRLEDGLKGSTAELAHTIETVSQRASETGAEIGNHAQQFERMSTMLVSDFRGFAGQLQENINGLNFTASNLGTETRKFGTEVRDMEQNLVALLNQSSDRLTGSHTDLSRAVAQAVSQVDQSAVMLLTDLESSHSRFNERFHAAGTDLLGGLQSHSENLTTQLTASSSGLMGAIQDSSDKYARALTDASLRLDASAESLTVGFGQTSQALAANLQGMSNSVNDLLVNTSGTIAAHLKDTSEIVNRQMQDSGVALAQAIESSGGSVTDRLISVSGEFVQRINTAQTNLIGNFVDSTGGVAAKLEEMSSAIHGRMRDSADNVLGNLNSLSSDINTKLLSTVEGSNSRLQETSNTILTHLASAVEGSNSRWQDTSEAILGQLNAISLDVNEKLLTTIDSSNGRLQDTADSVLGQLGSISGDVNEKIATAAVATSGRLRDTVDEVLAQLGITASELNDKLLTTTDATAGRMASIGTSLSTRLDQATASLGSLMTATEMRLGNHMDQATIELDALFSHNNKMLTEQLEQSSDLITRSFADRANQTSDALNSAALAATTKVDEASQAMFARINRSASELGTRFDEARDHLESVTSQISQRMDGQGRRFAELLDEHSDGIFTDLGKARDAFAEGLGETTLQISGRFEQETGLLVSRIDRAISEFSGSADTASGKLDEAADKFGKHVSNTNSLLANQLADAVTDIDTRLESVSVQLTSKLELTSARISERLDDVSSLVEKSVDKFNTEIEQTLTSRRDMLDSLVNDANRRATAVDKAMSNYISLIDSNMEAAESRAKNISQIVADQTSASIARLEEELQRLESSSSNQVVQAARALREQQERALTSMNEMLASTAADFQQTAQDMRITAQQVVKDIDGAREELKRAVIDLPEETRNNADNMRRVVADQISALNQLADVVRKQSVSLDFSSPGYISSRTGTGPAKAEVVSAPVTRSTASRSEAPRLSERKTNSLAKEVDGFTAKLNVAARDVIESMEGQLPRDLERRYANDKNVYATRLYEMRSRKTIKSLEERYAEERLLRSRIQAYNRLFEKLLDTISDADGSDTVMEEVLASEQGRVYVMLAEAAGRLPSQS